MGLDRLTSGYVYAAYTEDFVLYSRSNGYGL